MIFTRLQRKQRILQFTDHYGDVWFLSWLRNTYTYTNKERIITGNWIQHAWDKNKRIPAYKLKTIPDKTKQEFGARLTSSKEANTIIEASRKMTKANTETDPWKRSDSRWSRKRKQTENEKCGVVWLGSWNSDAFQVWCFSAGFYKGLGSRSLSIPPVGMPGKPRDEGAWWRRSTPPREFCRRQLGPAVNSRRPPARPSPTWRHHIHGTTTPSIRPAKAGSIGGDWVINSRDLGSNFRILKILSFKYLIYIHDVKLWYNIWSYF